MFLAPYENWVLPRQMQALWLANRKYILVNTSKQKPEAAWAFVLDSQSTKFGLTAAQAESAFVRHIQDCKFWVPADAYFHKFHQMRIFFNGW